MKMERENNIRKVLRRDSLHEAEQLTGRDSHDHEPTVWLGMAIMADLSAKKQRLLENTGDTTFSNKLDRYVRIISGMGFEQVLDVPFMGRVWGNEPAPEEHFYVYFEPRRGILLKFDTYRSESVNGGNFYYNWQPDNQEGRYSGVISSGSYVHSNGELVRPLTWSGDHDCREALKFHIQELEREGSFLTPWIKTPHLWLAHHMDAHGLEGYKAKSLVYEQVNQERRAALPDYVREVIGG